MQDRRGPLRRAIEDGDNAGVLESVRQRCTPSSDGCWVWNHRTDREGYATYRFMRKRKMIEVYVARAVVQATLDRALGDEQVHHMCATKGCCNPEHLAPVTASANAAEMFARHAYERRITALECALTEIAPNHPVLLR